MNTKLFRSIPVIAIFAVLAHPLSAQEGPNRPPLVTVTGTADINVMPDKADLSLGVDSEDKDLLLAKAENDRRLKRLMALAHAHGIEPKDIQTSRVSMRAEYSHEKIPRLTGYRISQTVTLTLTDLSKYESLMTESVKGGVNRVNGIYFYVAHPEKSREEARLKAIQAARDKAEAMAAKLGQRIGKAWEIKEGSDSGDFRPYGNVSLITKSGTAIEGEDATISGGEVTISESVTVSFLLE